MNCPKISVTGICGRIAEIRKKKHMTQRQLASMIGKVPTTISDYERHNSQPPIDVIQKIADALEIPTAYLIYGENILDEI